MRGPWSVLVICLACLIAVGLLALLSFLSEGL